MTAGRICSHTFAPLRWTAIRRHRKASAFSTAPSMAIRDFAQPISWWWNEPCTGTGDPVRDRSPLGLRRKRSQQQGGEAVGGLSAGDFADGIAGRRFHLSIKVKGIDAEHWRVFLITWIYK
jgi:hypothetical protein